MSERGAVPVPNLGNFAPFALLTGAGFSCNWGGAPAAKIWERIVSRSTLVGNERLQRVLAESVGDYERALHLARTTRLCTQDDYRVLEGAVIEVFRSQERDISAPARRAGINEHLVREFLSFFGPGPIMPNMHVQYGTGYVFTLNQDWLVERIWDGSHPNYRHRAVVPGVPIRMERYAAHQSDPFDVNDSRRVPETRSDRWPPKLHETQNYIKLHGSFEWRSSDGENVLVMGGGKEEQIRRFPLLRMFFEIFRRVCETPRVRLMVIGYGFGDPHVNEVIANACRQRVGERWLFVIDILPPALILSNLRSRGGVDGATIADAIFGWSTDPLTEIFAPPNSSMRTESYRRLLRDFFGFAAL